jgi:hypothetical protein
LRGMRSRSSRTRSISTALDRRTRALDRSPPIPRSPPEYPCPCFFFPGCKARRAFEFPFISPLRPCRLSWVLRLARIQSVAVPEPEA